MSERKAAWTSPGESLVIDPEGRTVLKADDEEKLVTCDLDLSEARREKERRPFLSLRRPEMYR